VAPEADVRPPDRAALGTRVREEMISHPAENDDAPSWEQAAEKELKRIPFFVRGKARRNTEAFARENGIARITLETLYDAKAHYGR
jgi:light-independent protochlorophyllide reductase subunit B